MSKEHPKDLKAEFKSKNEVFWTEVRDSAEDQIEGLEKALKLQKALLTMAKENIEIEKKISEVSKK